MSQVEVKAKIHRAFAYFREFSMYVAFASMLVFAAISVALVVIPALVIALGITAGVFLGRSLHSANENRKRARALARFAYHRERILEGIAEQSKSERQRQEEAVH